MPRRFQFSLGTLMLAMLALSLLLGAEYSVWQLWFPLNCAAWAAIGGLVRLSCGRAEDYAAKGAAVGIIMFLLRNLLRVLALALD